MYNEENIKTTLKLCIKLFGKGFENSKEFTTFTAGNPHPLRIIIEGEISIIASKLLACGEYYSREEIDKNFGLSGVGDIVYKQFNLPDRDKLLKRRDLLKDLERLIMECIENSV